jgi:NAD(P)-dependent dehydrogenase (short-subunit alcohol dehydrogenase family)
VPAEGGHAAAAGIAEDGLATTQGLAAHPASKGGIAAFTHSLALEYAGRGLRGVSIVPGGIRM